MDSSERTAEIVVFFTAEGCAGAEERTAAEAVNGNLFAIINILAAVKFDII